MAKRNKGLKDIREALHAQTRMIQPHETAPPQKQTAEPEFTIDKAVAARLQLLARFENKTYEQIVNEALEYFVRLKQSRISQAMEQLQIGTDED